MIRISIAVFTTLATLLTVASVTHAEPVLYTADKWHARIYFTVNHMGLSDYGGRFVEHDIRFMFDEDNMGNSSIEVSVHIEMEAFEGDKVPYYSKDQ